MSTPFSLNGKIGLDASDLVSNAAKGRKAVDEVADAIDKVDAKRPSPTVEVTDKATPDLKRLETLVDGLEGDDVKIKLEAEDAKLRAAIREADRQLQDLDGTAAKPVLQVRNQAKADLEEVERQLRKDIPDAASDGGKEASSSLADGFSDLKGKGGALLGGAIGTAIVGGLMEGMDRIEVRNVSVTSSA